MAAAEAAAVSAVPTLAVSAVPTLAGSAVPTAAGSAVPMAAGLAAMAMSVVAAVIARSVAATFKDAQGSAAAFSAATRIRTDRCSPGSFAPVGPAHGQSSYLPPAQPGHSQQPGMLMPHQQAGVTYHQPAGNGFAQQPQPEVAQTQAAAEFAGRAQLRQNNNHPLATANAGSTVHRNTVPRNNNSVASTRANTNGVIPGASGRGEHVAMKPKAGSSARNDTLLTKMRGSSGASSSQLPRNNKGTLAKGTTQPKHNDPNVIQASKTGTRNGSTATGRGTKVADAKTKNTGKASTGKKTKPKTSVTGATGKPAKSNTSVAGTPGKQKGTATAVASASDKTTGATPGTGKKGAKTTKTDSKGGGAPGVKNPKGKAALDFLAGVLDALSGSVADGLAAGSAEGADGDGSEPAVSDSMASGDSESEIAAAGDAAADGEGDSDVVPAESLSGSTPVVVINNLLGAQTESNNASPAVNLVVPEGSASAASQDVPASRLILTNPKDSSAQVSYALEGSAYVLDPDGVQVADGGGPWLVEFDRVTWGEGARYSLTPGTYTFTMTAQGWELYNTTGAISTTEGPAPADQAEAVSQENAVTERLLVVNRQGLGRDRQLPHRWHRLLARAGREQRLLHRGKMPRGVQSGVKVRTLATRCARARTRSRKQRKAGSFTTLRSKSRWTIQPTTAISITFRDGQEESVAAGATRTLTDKFPLKLSFDRGDGGAAAERTLDSNGATYRIAVAKDFEMRST